MQYFKDNNNEIYAYDDEQVAQGYGKDMTPITKEEVDAILNPFSKRQSNKLMYVKQSFSTSLSKGYTCSNGILMDCDLDSINKLKAGYDLAVSAGATIMNIRDYNNVVHSNIAIADVNNMLIELGSNYQTQLAKKWDLESQINNATTQAELDAIAW